MFIQPCDVGGKLDYTLCTFSHYVCRQNTNYAFVVTSCDCIYYWSSVIIIYTWYGHFSDENVSVQHKYMYTHNKLCDSCHAGIRRQEYIIKRNVGL